MPHAKSSPPRSVRGFTLIELLVVISIIALLVALLLPALASARQTALSIQCESNQKGLGILFANYNNNYKGWCIPAYYDAVGTGFNSADSRFQGGGYTVAVASANVPLLNGLSNQTLGISSNGIPWPIYLDGLYPYSSTQQSGKPNVPQDGYQKQLVCPSRRGGIFLGAYQPYISYGYNALGLGCNENFPTYINSIGPAKPYAYGGMERVDSIPNSSRFIETTETRWTRERRYAAAGFGFALPTSFTAATTTSSSYHSTADAYAPYFAHMTAYYQGSELNLGVNNTLFCDGHVKGYNAASAGGNTSIDSGALLTNGNAGGISNLQGTTWFTSLPHIRMNTSWMMNNSGCTPVVWPGGS